ncbi:hypothetical protein GCM10027343_05680 [Noviherbaspirillum agri]
MPITFFKQTAGLAALTSLLLAPPLQAQLVAPTVVQTPADAEVSKALGEPRDTAEFANLAQWREVTEFIDQMVEKHGFNRTELEDVFRQVRYVDRAIQLIKPAPATKPKNWQAYRARFVEPLRIKAGVAFWDAHADTLARAEEQYGVPAEIIVGIIGVETIYGRNTGSFRVLDALATLGFDYPPAPNRTKRMEFFRRELEQTLLFARESRLNPFELLGSYAGAIGLPQFMPGSIRRYAVDFNGDGKVDLRNSPIDAIGSVANFLVDHGWRRGEPIVFPATVASSDNPASWEKFIGQGLEAKYSLEELSAAGVSPGADSPATLSYGLVDLQNGTEPTEYWLGTANFFAVTKYNRSFFYAMSVVDLGRAVRQARSR